jgi:VanZ family protein
MNRLLTFIKTNWIVITLLTLTVITVLSLWPLEELPLVPGGDKIHHMIAYAVLMFPAALRKPVHWRLIGLFFIAYGGAIELVQPYVNRYSEWLDVAANTTGIICGLILAEVLIRSLPVVLNRPR